MNVDTLPEAVAQNFHLHEMEWPEDEAQRHAMLDAPFRFGDCPMDNLQGVINLARNADVILKAPQVPMVPAGVPVIAIGSGPSLALHLADLRALQHKAVLIASISSVDGLRSCGIEPHYALPIERTEDVMDWMPQCGPSLIFAGAPYVAEKVMSCFQRHCYMPDVNSLCAWSSMPGDLQYFYGSSTGTAAVSMGANITKGPLYLVGHDLAYEGAGASAKSHWSGAKSAPMELEGSSMGNSGQFLSSTWLWRRYNAMISALAQAHGNIVNLNIANKRGAMIPHTIAGVLPDAATLPDYQIPVLPDQPQRLALWRQRAVQMPRHVRQAMRVFQGAKLMDDLDMAKAVPGPNGLLLAYVCGSIYAQMSYELQPNLPGKIAVAPRHIVIDWCRTALLNVLRESMGLFDEVARIGDGRG